MKTDKHFYILSHGRVAAINKKDGSIVWEIKLKAYYKNGSGFGYGQISVEGTNLFVAVSGVLFCLSTKDGSLIWLNELKGWGYNFISIAGAGNESVAASASSNAVVATAVISAAT